MFTGIIQDVGTVLSVTPKPEARVVRLATGYRDLEAGESVAINGVCLTVTELNSQGAAEFFVSRETLKLTNLGSLEAGSKVNLERALRLDSRLSGHMVQGHADGLARFVSATRVSSEGEDCFEIELDVPASESRYLIKKGSIGLNGVSLTINSLAKRDTGVRVGITLIPHTWNHTNLSQLKPGDPVNVEVDVLAKYVEANLAHLKPMESPCPTP